MYSVKLSDIIIKMKLTNLTPEVDIASHEISQSDVNRPALQLAGFYDYFDADRAQIIGKVEYTFIENMAPYLKLETFERLFGSKIPCLILARSLEPDEDMIAIAKRHGVPLLQTKLSTSYFLSELTRYLKVELAPSISIHGVLVDVYGEGILIKGESGIGKSEAALELIKRGHRLVADDVVEIKKVSDDTLLGTSPDIIRHFIEVRGIGIVDCKTLFGVESVKESQTIDLIINLTEWDRQKEYDRLGLEEEYDEILGNKVVSHTIPIRPGRNLAIIVESAAINHRQKKMGYNAAVELNNRVTGNLLRRSQERDEENEKL
ncbi:HPr kinase/phosphorylase [Petrocella atlantisensis]|uniref:HPr kinase/phosphorylase n=1 Tax=Petrocella atlantisensis TaxID=2173034 RepID=A0A3P7RXG1_9FIRM|nr:HPr(Ser) kinase/phosphatase [Petrocella atlantisensis]MCF8019252.1 HPr(Ser) kinase/phosphatase [Vallitaleaceae bacterium]PKM55902.1 MAG: HPr(Ser) kinase/phosphatase [Firmicutes bacterium HGW-Firmicutes-5]VDN47416.1 HPr kinase/phosphorylase [Petrocella atlantisensis]